MAENSQLSDTTNSNSTDTSSTDTSSVVIGNHENAIVPHKISNHDKLVQTMVMVDGEWININDTNDQANMKEDMYKVNEKVVEAQKGIVEAKNSAESAVAYADSAVSASKVNSDAIAAQSSAISEAKAATDSAMSRAESAWNVATGAKEAVTGFDPLLKSAQSDAGKALTQIADTASALSDAKTAFGSDVAEAKGLANTAQATADNAIKSASSVVSDLTAVASQAKSNADGITKVTSDVGALQTTVANNSGDISKIQETASQIQQAVSDNAGNITVAKQTADSAATVASDAHSNATAAIQTASQASITANNASGQAASAVITASGALTTASDAKSNATVAIQTASGASLTATNASSDATVAKQTASEAIVQASNANSDFAQLSVRANKIEANVANNSGAIASVQQTANGLTSRVGNLESKTDTQQTAIDQNKAAIALKADQMTVDTLKGTVNQNTAALTTQANQIQAKVSASDVTGMLTGYATQTYAQSLVTQTANNWNVNLTSLQTDVNAIKTTGGGVNLLTSTSDFSSNWRGQSSVSTTTEYNGHPSLVFNPSSQQQLALQPVMGLENSFKYTVSFWAKADNEGDKAHTELWGSNGATDVVLTTNWARYTVVLTSYSDASTNIIHAVCYFGVPAGNTGNVYIALPMLEEGTVAHDWSPAPSDMATVTSVTNLSAAVDGIKSTVATKADQSTVTQLSNLVQSAVSTSDFTSKVSQLSNDINARVAKGDLLSQINIEAGNTLIQSNKIYLDAKSVVFGQNSEAFIPSAYITDINADKITTGTLDASKLQVKNFTADNIVGGTLSGVVVKTGDNDRYFQTSKNNIYWVRNGSMSLVGNDTYLNSANGLNIADEKNIQLTTWGGATVNKDGSITNNSGNYGHPKIVIDREGNFNPDDPYGSPFAGGPGNSEIVQWVGEKEYTALTHNQGFTVHLDDGNNNSKFSIQKDNKVGFYVGAGDNGNEIQIGAERIRLQGSYLDDGFNDAVTHTFGNIQVDNLHVRKWLGVDQSKNAIVKTSQGSVTINAYETAEYYFGDIGEGQTNNDGIAYIGIEKLFNETVNTTIPYHVFITAYGPGNIWVAQREHNRFVVKSDQPNLKFSWEIKAKRKGYEHTRLQNADDKLNHMEATS